MKDPLSKTMFQIRPITFDDLVAADRVISSAFQTTSRLAELEWLMRLEGTSWLAGEEDGRLAGMVGAIDYGSFAYVGMMGVHTDYQKRGYGKALMLALLEQLDHAAKSCTLLDASEQGAPLYTQIGYVDLSLAHVLRQDAKIDFQSPIVRVEPLGLTSLPELVTIDQPIFGADRGQALRAHLLRYPGRCFGACSAEGLPLGYVIAQNKRIGPWVASTPEVAASLLRAVLELDFAAPPEVILPSPNRVGLELLQTAGFVLKYSLRHMRRGCLGLKRSVESIYGQSSFMLG